MLSVKDIKSQEIVKWLYKFTMLINKIFYSRGETDTKFCWLVIGKHFQWKERVKVNYYQRIFGLGVFFPFYILLHHPSVGFTSWGIAKGKTSFWRILSSIFLTYPEKWNYMHHEITIWPFNKKTFQNNNRKTYIREQTNTNNQKNKAPTLEPRVISCEVASERTSVFKVV